MKTLKVYPTAKTIISELHCEFADSVFVPFTVQYGGRSPQVQCILKCIAKVLNILIYSKFITFTKAIMSSYEQL